MGEISDKIAVGLLSFTVGAAATVAGIHSSQNVRDLLIRDRWITGKIIERNPPSLLHPYITRWTKYDIKENNGTKVFHVAFHYPSEYEKALPLEGEEVTVRIGRPVTCFPEQYREVIERR